MGQGRADAVAQDPSRYGDQDRPPEAERRHETPFRLRAFAPGIHLPLAQRHAANAATGQLAPARIANMPSPTRVKDALQSSGPTNDILVQGKKVCGILIENHVSGDEISHSIVGIGININQISFHYPRAGSLSLFNGKEYPLADVLRELLQIIETRYLELKQGKRRELENRYLELLYQKDEVHRFEANHQVFDGTITGVNEAGQLAMIVDNKKRFFGVKELTFL